MPRDIKPFTLLAQTEIKRNKNIQECIRHGQKGASRLEMGSIPKGGLCWKKFGVGGKVTLQQARCRPVFTYMYTYMYSGDTGF